MNTAQKSAVGVLAALIIGAGGYTIVADPVTEPGQEVVIQTLTQTEIDTIATKLDGTFVTLYVSYQEDNLDAKLVEDIFDFNQTDVGVYFNGVAREAYIVPSDRVSNKLTEQEIRNIIDVEALPLLANDQWFAAIDLITDRVLEELN